MRVRVPFRLASSASGFRGFFRAVFGAAFALLCAAILATSFEASVTVFGPETFTRQNGPPTAVHRTINVSASHYAYILRIVNRGEASAVIGVNGRNIFVPSDFRKDTKRAVLTASVTLRPGPNDLSVELRGQPESSLTIDISTAQEDLPPVARIAPIGQAFVAQSVTLDGRGSSDPEGHSLAFQWTVTSRPAASTSTIAGANTSQPSFVPDRFGVYQIRLVVNDGQHQRAADVTFATSNTAPVADAGPDQTTVVQQTITLDGSRSSDVDGDALTYHWNFVSVPGGSLATLADHTTVAPTFVPDRPGTYVLNLAVSDGKETTTALVTVSTRNSKPVAKAGSDRSSRIGQAVQLDGTASTDIDGQPLSYTWTLLSGPAGSSSALQNSTSIQPTLIPDKRGTFEIQLVVHDGMVESDPDVVLITTENTPPVAKAGPDQTGHVGELMHLTAADSTDVDGDPLTFAWSFVSKPPGSVAVLDQPPSIGPHFTIDQPGTYVLQLFVNDGAASSTSDTVTISTVNSLPAADAGPDQSVVAGGTVTLDGIASRDADGDPLSYRWSLLALPPGSTAALNAPAERTTMFVADRAGTYIAQLVVNDGHGDSLPDTVVISTTNSAPIANAGPDQIVNPGVRVQLDGQLSTDPDGTVLTYSWALINKPAGSGATLDAGDSAFPRFTADFPGTYLIQLVVSDGVLSGGPDTVVIQVNASPTVDAGPDQTAFTTDSVTLNGSATDDGLPGGALTYAWTMVSGPTSVTFLSPSSAVTPAGFVASGAYRLRLTVSDGALSAFDDVNVVITSITRQGPIVSAGPDLSTSLLSPTILRGQASENGMPAGTAMRVLWSKVSGPGDVTFADPASTETTALFGRLGTYVLRLTATDSVTTVGDDVAVQVECPNGPYPNGVTLCDDFNRPDGAVTNGWGSWRSTTFEPDSNIIGVRGGELLTHGDPDYAGGVFRSLPVTFPLSFSFDFKPSYDVQNCTPFTDDEGGWGISFNAAPGTSTALLSDVTPSQLLLLHFAGQRRIVRQHWNGTEWIRDSAPEDAEPVTWMRPYAHDVPAHIEGSFAADLSGTVRIWYNDGQSPEFVTVNFPALTGRVAPAPGGTFVFGNATCNTGHFLFDNLDVRSDGASGNRPPVVNAGPDQTIAIATHALLEGSAHDDGVPNGTLTYAWTMVSGPGKVAFGAALNAVTSASFEAPGNYLLRLSASDGALIGFDDVAITVLPVTVNKPPVVNAGPDQSLPGFMGAPPTTVSVSGRAKVFSAGGAVPIGDGVAPPGVVFAAAPNQVLTFESVSGTVSWGSATVGPNGGSPAPANTDGTDLVSQAGISGIRDIGNVMFLTGVFLDDSAPEGAPPATLDFSGTEAFTTLSPSVGQTFFIGDGTTAGVPKIFNVPASATRLFLGFADGSLFHGVPSLYGDNSGSLTATFRIQGRSTILDGVVTDDGLPIGGPLSINWALVGAFNLTINTTTRSIGDQLGPGWPPLEGNAWETTFTLPGEPLTDAQLTIETAEVQYLDNRVIVNGTVVDYLPLNDPDTLKSFGVLVPASVLKAGTNTLRLESAFQSGNYDDVRFRNITLATSPVMFSNPTSPKTQATFLAPGKYTLRLTANDTEFTVSDEAIVTIGDGNKRPAVSAGLDRTVALSDPVKLSGSVLDDGLPAGSTVSATWTRVSGPGAVTFADVHSPVTTATFSGVGVYVLQLTATDTALSTSAQVQVTVKLPPALTSANPGTAIQGETLSVNIVGTNTSFVQNSTIVNFGSGVTVNAVTVLSSTTLTAQITVTPVATLGSHIITVTTGSESASLVSGFTVVQNGVAISVAPSTAYRGQQLLLQVTGQFTHFASQLTQVSLGAGITVNTVTVQSATALLAQLNVSCDAEIGARTVTVATGNEVVSSGLSALRVEAVTGDLLAVSTSSAAILRFDLAGKLLGQFVTSGSGGLRFPANPILGPDGNLYVSDRLSNAIRRYSGATGEYLDDFVAPGVGGLADPLVTAFGPDGNLYVADNVAKVVRRYNGTTKAYMGVFSSGGNLVVPAGMAFGPDGNLFVGDEVNVVQFNGVTGQFMGTFVPAGRGGLSGPGLIRFGCDNNLYVATANSGVLRFDGTGTFVSPSVASMTGTRLDGGLEFSPNNEVFVGTFHGGEPTDDVRRYDPKTGTLIDTLIPSGVIGSLNGLLFRPTSGPPAIRSVTPNTGIQGQQNVKVTVSGRFTHFVAGTTDANVGAGITVSSVAVDSPTTATIVLSIDPSASTGPRTLTLTTGAETVFFNNGFVVQDGTARLISLSDVSALPGQTLSVSIVGQFTHFVQGVSQVSLGAGITVITVTVASPTSLTARIAIDPTAGLGTRAVTVATGGETASLANGFVVESPATGQPTLLAVSPSSVMQGEQSLTVDITGQFTHFVEGVTTATFGEGVRVAGQSQDGVGPISVGSPTSAIAHITVPPRPDWSRVIPDGSIPGRVFHTQSYDPVGNNLLVFGGLRSNDGGAGEHLNDVWRLSNANGDGPSSWTQVIPGGTPPSRRAGMTSAYDPGSDRLIVFGGFVGTTAPCLNETWVLVNATSRNGTPTWQQLATSGALPGVRWGHGMAYDSANNRLIVTGGGNCFNGSDYGDVWVLKNANGLGGQPEWTQLTPTGIGPGTRTYVSVAYDETTNRLIMVGGRKADLTYPHDIWLLSNANGLGGTPAWSQLLSSSPAEPSFLGATYDSATNRLLVFTATCGNPTAFLFTNANGLGGPVTYAALGPFETPPVPLILSWMSYDSKADRLITFGGFARSGPALANQIGQADTWVLRSAIRNAFVGPRSVTVRTGTEVVTLVDGFNVTMQAFSAPTARLAPGCAAIGTEADVQITGIDATFVQGITQARFGPGVAVGGAAPGDYGPVTVVSSHRATAHILVSSTAMPGERVPIVKTGSQELSPAEPFLVTDAQDPAVQSVSPVSGHGGETLTLTVLGSRTAFQAGVTTVDLGSGIAVQNVTVTSPTLLRATVEISPDAAVGQRTLTVTTGGQVSSLLGGFSVESSSRSIVQVSPNVAKQGLGGELAITGANTHFVQGVTQLSLGAGISISDIVVSCPTCMVAQVRIADDAPTGPHPVTVTTGAEVASLSDGFRVDPGIPILMSFSKASGSQGQTFAVTITGRFTHFSASLTAVSLGAGVTLSGVSVISPTTLTALVTVNAAAALGPRDLTVTTGSEIVTAPGIFSVTATATLTSIEIVPSLPTAVTKGDGIAFLARGHFADGSTQDPLPGVTWSATTGVGSVSNDGLFIGTSVGVARVKAIRGSVQSPETLVTVRPQVPQLLIPIIEGETTVGGAAEPTASVQLLVNGTPRGAAVAAANGAWLTPVFVPAVATGDVVTAIQTVAGIASGLSPPVVVIASPPALLSVTPLSAPRGSTANLTIVARNTHFVAGVTTLSLGAGGETVTNVTVTSATTLNATVSFAGALLGARPVTVTTGQEVVLLPGAFTVLPGVNAAPTITIAPAWTVTLPNRLLLPYTIADDGLPSGGRLTVSFETLSGPGDAGFLDQSFNSVSVGFDTAGIYNLRVTATDTAFTVSKDIIVTVASPGSGGGLTALLSNPVDGAEVTAPIELRGTVGGNALASWRAEFRQADDATYRTIATGNAPIANGLLGQLDPTLYVNGIGYLRVTATDTGGGTVTSEAITVVLTKNQKLGHFTVSFKDLEVPLSGVAIQLLRTYDSRIGAVGEFGVGWSLDVRNVKLRDNGKISLDWYGNVIGSSFSRRYCIQGTRAHVLTVTLSDGTVYRFEPQLDTGIGFFSPAVPNCQPFAPIASAKLAFKQVSGPPATLRHIGAPNVVIESAWPGPVELLDENSLEPVDFNRYTLTLPDGRTLTLNRGTGLEQLSDTNGNSLTVTQAGIFHSSGTSIAFQRDAQQRVTRVTDPAGQSLLYAYDSVGNLASVTDQVGNITTFGYDANHRLTSITDPRGIEPIRNEYDASGRLIRHVDGVGNTIGYVHDIAGRREVIMDRLGHETVNEYDSDGNVTRVIDALGGQTIRTYDGLGNVLTETDANGHTKSYTYDANNNRLSESDALGNTTRYTYTALNRVDTITDPLGRTTKNSYDAAGNLISTRDPLGNVTQYTYDTRGNRTSTTDPLNGVTAYEYDSKGNLTKQVDPLAHATTYTYDANGNRRTEAKTQTTPSGPRVVTTTFEYDAQNRLTRTIYPDGSITRTAYSSIGKQASTFDQLGRETKYEYDTMGRLVVTRFADGTSETATYDAEGNRVSSTDRGGRTTTYTYDELKRLTRTTQPDGAVERTEYDAVGKVARSIDARGNATQFGYDPAGRREAVTDALGHITRFAYDAAGNQRIATDANNHVTQFGYDPLNRRTRTVYHDGTFDDVGYDALGRTVSKRDQAGIVTLYQYDALGRLTAAIDVLNQQTSYSYDELGNRTLQTDANNHTTRFDYDAMGRRTKRTLPLGMAEALTYDLAGNLATKMDFNGKSTAYRYDANNRLTSKTPDPTLSEPTIRFTYTATGQRAQMVDASGTTSYFYDQRDRLKLKETPQGTLSYTYDVAGNLSSMRSSNVGGTSVDYGYDALNRLATVTDNRLASGVTTYAYDNVGNLASYRYPNGVTHTYSYNTLNRLADLVVASGPTTIASYAYTMGPTGNRTTVVELGGRRVDYTYDELYRLKSETISGGLGGTTTYTYDSVGNRRSRSSPITGLANYDYDSNDRLVSDSYDANGNTTLTGGASYAYDSENRLTTQNGGAIKLIYDGDGNRIGKTAGGVTTQYLVDDRNVTGFAQVIEELTAGAVQRVYTYGLNRISERQADGAAFYVYDGHGSVRIVTNTIGEATDQYQYDAFGSLLAQTGTTPNVYRYSGEQLDPNIGFYYLRDRYYSVVTGRFVTVDSFDGDEFDPASLHKYLYGGADPVNRVDPSGQSFTLTDTLVTVNLIATFVQVVDVVHQASSLIQKARTNADSIQAAELRTFAASVALTALPVLSTAPKLLGVSRVVQIFEDAGFTVRTVSADVALSRQSYGVFYHVVQKMLSLDISAERVFETLWQGQKLFDQERNTFAFFLKLPGEAEGTVVIYSKGVLITVYKAVKLSAQRFIPVP